MGIITRRLLCVLLLFALCLGNTVEQGWAKEREIFVEEAWAWIDEGEVRFQAQLSGTPDKVELSVSQGSVSKIRSFHEESQISLAVMPMDDSPIQITMSIDDAEGPLRSWELSLPEHIEPTVEIIKIKKAPWDEMGSDQEEPLTLVEREGEDKNKNEAPAEEAEHKQDQDQDASDEELSRLAEEFYAHFSSENKPGEAELRNREVRFEVEPNDTLGSKSDWLFDGKDSHGKISSKDDVDFWKIRGTTKGQMNISLTDIPANEDYDLYVYDEGEGELARSEQHGNESELIEGLTLEKDKWYYIKVVGKQGSFSKNYYYRLRADFSADHGGGGKADGYEPNDTREAAYKLDAYNRKIVGNLHSKTDVDFYSLSFPLSSTVEVSLKDIPTGMDMDVFLLDEAGKVVASSAKAKNSDEHIIFNAYPGTYIVKVMASKRSGFTANSYSLYIGDRTIPVILIPGVGGSRLEVEQNGKRSEIWLGLGDSLIGINDPKHRRLLSLEPIKPNSIDVQPVARDATIHPEKDDFYAIEYLSYAPFLKELTEQYYSMVKELEKAGYKKHRTLFALPYDWRYSSTKNAKLLKEKIDAALKASGANQVHLVAHSMGGLLVKETLLSNVSYQRKVNRVVYMGTPFLGSPRAYQALKHGYNFSIPWLDEETGKVISSYAPAVYELLPSKKYFESVGFLKRSNIQYYTYDDFLKDKNIRLDYAPLVRHGGQMHEKWDNKTINVPQYSIVGTGQVTLLGYFYDSFYNEWSPILDPGVGDGTVPYMSANYAQKDMKKRYYVKGEHAKLPTIPEVIDQVTRLLQGDDELQPGLRNAPDQNADYLYYIIAQDDKSFPEVTIHKSGQTFTLDVNKKEVREDLSIEYHDRIVVIHVRDGEDLEFQPPVAVEGAEPARFLIKRFSSDDSERYKETGRRYVLDERGLAEVEQTTDSNDV
ncbi:probable esterase [Brevibacillus brevis NBRC 100599]|uniref:Probable esterase n=1 Tax=Brevibacillus brevis (strain 47 / JCM 6285 / NBRC 100599) TaxID=358681 RepID=C0Z864_BREBN|nr:pre-peptidase C-terminal domain-containing protein [Brevibacillus brevis]BAH46491.1 probable esterase [Brevibacillus brevis NBRC 100599]